MTRLKQAWLALTRGLDVIHLPGRAMVCKVYRADWTESYFTGRGFGSISRRAYFETCAEAHATGHQVTAVEVIRAGGGYYYLPEKGMRKLPVQPKPKVAKGKRK